MHFRPPLLFVLRRPPPFFTTNHINIYISCILFVRHSQHASKVGKAEKQSIFHVPTILCSRVFIFVRSVVFYICIMLRVYRHKCKVCRRQLRIYKGKIMQERLSYFSRIHYSSSVKFFLSFLFLLLT